MTGNAEGDQAGRAIMVKAMRKRVLCYAALLAACDGARWWFGLSPVFAIPVSVVFLIAIVRYWRLVNQGSESPVISGAAAADEESDPGRRAGVENARRNWRRNRLLMCVPLLAAFGVAKWRFHVSQVYIYAAMIGVVIASQLHYRFVEKRGWRSILSGGRTSDE
jgi:hypothetical protein